MRRLALVPEQVNLSSGPIGIRNCRHLNLGGVGEATGTRQLVEVSPDPTLQLRVLQFNLVGAQSRFLKRLHIHCLHRNDRLLVCLSGAREKENGRHSRHCDHDVVELSGSIVLTFLGWYLHALLPPVRT
ncbi:hypothetical protein AB0C12_10695 [Actinoplanes sp. NPDC048967]|uniref:hypothetical protein n=1 Tax=Actinoplanes sp. NPDC048967 TaxID=3155269 RepID=UPI0033E62238